VDVDTTVSGPGVGWQAENMKVNRRR